jgi:hypothetical protein
MDAKPDNLWHYIKNGEQKGPVEKKWLLEQIANDGLPRDVMVWSPGMGTWIPASEVPEIAELIPPRLPHIPPPPPIPVSAQQSSDKPIAGQSTSDANTTIKEGVISVLSDFVRADEALTGALLRQRPPKDSVSGGPTDAISVPLRDVGVDPPERNGEVHPWHRFLARNLDYVFLALILGTVMELLNPGWYNTQESDVVLGMGIMVLWMPVEIFSLALFGRTPGKWLLNIKVLSVNGGKMTPGEAINRSVGVWVVGLGIGFPIISLITVIASYNKLTREKTTAWDKDRFVIEHNSPGGFLRTMIWILAALVTALIVLASFPID